MLVYNFKALVTFKTTKVLSVTSHAVHSAQHTWPTHAEVISFLPEHNC